MVSWIAIAVLAGSLEQGLAALDRYQLDEAVRLLTTAKGEGPYAREDYIRLYENLGLAHAYREKDSGGYSVAMPADASETLFSAMNILWFVVSVIAATLLVGSIHRRRSRLTQSLRNYVDQNQDGGGVVSRIDEASKD